MSVISAIATLLAAGGDYQIQRSVRLRASVSAYLSRTFSSASTNRQRGTLSFWLKRGAMNSQMILVSCYDGSSTNSTEVQFTASNQLEVYFGGSALNALTTTAVFRDPSAWYHIVVSVDTTQATAANRVVLYVNGVAQVLSTANYPAQNTNWQLAAQNANNRIGTNWNNTGAFFDGYLTEVNFIDGQALTPAAFGETDPVTGVWKPKKYAGTYGTNGFYLDFSDPSAATATAIGKDRAGSNNWTPNNISVTAGSTYDSMLDVPTMWADGGNGRGNYCTLNPVNPPNGVTISAANLNFSNTDDATPREAFATQAVRTGKWYWEATKTNTCDRFYTGIVETIYRPGQAISFGKLAFDTSTSSNVTVMFAVDFALGKYWSGINGTWSGNPATNTGGTSFTVGSNDWVPLVGGYRETQPSAVGFVNFGQRPFLYTPPSGFAALHTGNLPEPTIRRPNQWMDVRTRAGTSTATTVSGYSFTPDLVWIKIRSGNERHVINDTVRGAQRQLASNLTDAENTASTGALTAFTADGYSLDADLTFGRVNNAAYTYVDWAWKRGATPGFDIVTYTGNATARTIAHSLGVAPAMIICKSRGSAQSWQVYHSAVGATRALYLNLTNAQSAASAVYWNNTAPTSSVFSLGTDAGGNDNAQPFVAYLFAEVPGFSKFGSYTGNGSTDGPFVHCGFRPRFVMVKRTDAAQDWFMWDAARLGYNQSNYLLFADTSQAEYSGTESNVDLLSNGFKIRAANPPSAGSNASGGTYIFMAFAETPFKYSLAR